MSQNYKTKIADSLGRILKLSPEKQTELRLRAQYGSKIIRILDNNREKYFQENDQKERELQVHLLIADFLDEIGDEKYIPLETFNALVSQNQSFKDPRKNYGEMLVRTRNGDFREIQKDIQK